MPIRHRIETLTFSAPGVLTLDQVALDLEVLVAWCRHAATIEQGCRHSVQSHAERALEEVLARYTVGALLESPKQLHLALRHSLRRRLAHWGLDVHALELSRVAPPAAWQAQQDERLRLALRQRQASFSAARQAQAQLA